MTQVVLTGASPGSNETYNVPVDWNNSANTVECIGAGGGAGACNTTTLFICGGGGGGAYARSANVSLTPGGTATFQVGAGGAGSPAPGNNGGAGGSTWFNGTTAGGSSCAAGGGGGGLDTGGETGGAGGSAIVANQASASGGAGGDHGGATSGSGGGVANNTNEPGGVGRQGIIVLTYTPVPAPTVTGVSPSSGPTGGGTSVTITGTTFTGATAVKFGATDAASFTVNNSTTITATSPSHAAGTVDITVTTPPGTSATSGADQFTFIAAPTVTSVVPNFGPVTGGTSVAITGTVFTGATAVQFGATNAASFTVNTSTSITATSPVGSLGTVDITVTTPGGTSATSGADQFTYVSILPAPNVIGRFMPPTFLVSALLRQSQNTDVPPPPPPSIDGGSTQTMYRLRGNWDW